jgi:hypothetical protein
MLSIALTFWANITIIIVDIIHRPVFYLKDKVSETVFCLRLQVETTQMDPIDRAISSCFRRQRLTISIGPI